MHMVHPTMQQALKRPKVMNPT